MTRTPMSTFTSAFFDPQIEQEIWQQRAAAQLPAILAAGRGLPPVAWTVGAAGAVIAGRLPRSGRPMSQRAAFEAWRHALGLTMHVGVGPGDPIGRPASAHLSATGTRGGVRVHLSATILCDDHDDHDEGRTGS
ncbi:hypothetical protein [Nonomuraea sp. 10N515B]|uniref:hypothetical protein n=1 Tax=Nonomuraea sp. 10N515B TaxID=3457422 RepID=UPI003FCD8252